MRSGRLWWTMVSIALGVSAINIVIAYALARAVSRDPIVSVSPPILVALAAVGIGCLVAAGSAWRSHLRRRR